MSDDDMPMWVEHEIAEQIKADLLEVIDSGWAYDRFHTQLYPRPVRAANGTPETWNDHEGRFVNAKLAQRWQKWSYCPEPERVLASFLASRPGLLRLDEELMGPSTHLLGFLRVTLPPQGQPLPGANTDETGVAFHGTHPYCLRRILLEGLQPSTAERSGSRYFSGDDGEFEGLYAHHMNRASKALNYAPFYSFMFLDVGPEVKWCPYALRTVVEIQYVVANSRPNKKSDQLILKPGCYKVVALLVQTKAPSQMQLGEWIGPYKAKEEAAAPPER
ncbi:unnamed protein product [Symbiodinium natans]|uniref:Uncharacterized protein n=1 Tax=Symbiodinium natans TaxID=878477 RepID=A0A812UTB7_9DINO|nr:unnamed protein product [Symbiodinium natans]CAE7456569.1 unnamed protein product [Symbiodinium natans]CAE7589121.1 unnamed protein product [Symbiodinium natans]